MGQQQLLLLVFCIVIAGIATVAGIAAFSEGEAKAKQDAAAGAAMRIISDVQAWKLRPAAFGGGGDQAEANFTGVNLKALGYPVGSVGAPYFTTNGCYVLTGAPTGATLEIYAEHTSSACNPSTKIATVTITGPDNPQDISWSYTS